MPTESNSTWAHCKKKNPFDVEDKSNLAAHFYFIFFTVQSTSTFSLTFLFLSVFFCFALLYYLFSSFVVCSLFALSIFSPLRFSVALPHIYYLLHYIVILLMQSRWNLIMLNNVIDTVVASRRVTSLGFPRNVWLGFVTLSFVWLCSGVCVWVWLCLFAMCSCSLTECGFYTHTHTHTIVWLFL